MNDFGDRLLGGPSALPTIRVSEGDSHLLPELLHGNEKAVWGDSAYQGTREVIHALAPRARHMIHRRYRLGGWLDPVERRKNRSKSRVRAKVVHPFLVLKAIFGFRKVRYRGLAKNAQRLNVACALVNLFMLRRRLLRLAQETCR